jgi:recombinational DNA repair protein RecR
MTCSRCGCTAPNSSCYVCAEPERDEPDAFRAAKDAAFDDEEKQNNFPEP